jgi:myo-inositol 2-dehydrogenase/D-chiro-inositol 1-dehydrogenase
MSPRVRVGVVGAGAMGSAHVRTIADSVPHGFVTTVFDLDADRAAVAASSAGATLAGSAEELVLSDEVDAVLVASPDFTHADLVLACLKARKPVLCEKPLALTAPEALRVVDAEVILGRRLVQVGFMRRYDPAFADLRRAVTDGRLGDIRLVHAVHRNVSSTTSTDDAGLVTGSMVHELDIIPWLLNDQVRAVRVESPVTSGFRDPQQATVWTRGGVMATVEVFVNAAYGYDVQCEVVGTGGTAALGPARSLSSRIAGVEGRTLGGDFVAHFADAYRIELAAWIRTCLAGEPPNGPSAWDGYLANLAAEAGVRSLASGLREEVDPGVRPGIYDRVQC